MKELCSYPWVHETYGDALPKLPWIAAAAPLPGRAPSVATGTCP